MYHFKNNKRSKIEENDEIYALVNEASDALEEYEDNSALISSCTIYESFHSNRRKKLYKPDTSNEIDEINHDDCQFISQNKTIDSLNYFSIDAILSNSKPAIIKKSYKRKKEHNTFKTQHHDLDEEDKQVLQQGASLFNITSEEAMHTGNSKKYNCNLFTYKVKFNNSTEKTFGELTEEINNMFIQLHSDMLALVKGKDKINLRISHSSFVKPIIYPFMNRSDFANINLENTFFGVIQSYRTINVSEQNPLKLNVCLARLPSGAGGRKKNKIHPDLTSYRNNSPFIIPIVNKDKYCAIYATIVAIANYELTQSDKKDVNEENEEMEKKFRNQLKNAQKHVFLSSKYCKRNNQLKNEALDFLNNFKLPDDKEFGLEIFPLLEEYYKWKYQITIVSI